MYFVDRSKIEATLKHIDGLLEEIKDINVTNRLEELALERAVHMIIESVLDVGNMMIDGFIMRDPGSYHDIIDILIDEKVILSEDERAYKSVIDLRQMLVQNYLEIDIKKIESVMKKAHPTLSKFSRDIETYLDNELGVAHAFSNED